MKFDNSYYGFTGSIGPTDERFVKESDFGHEVWVGDLNREVGLSRDGQVCLSTTIPLRLGFVVAQLDLTVGEWLGIIIISCTSPFSNVLTPALRT